MANGDFTGYEYQVPIIVLTHHPPEIVALGADDRLTFTFVIDGIEHAIQEAKAAARNKDVTVVGGASTAQQCINAGLAALVIKMLFHGQNKFDKTAYKRPAETCRARTTSSGWRRNSKPQATLGFFGKTDKKFTWDRTECS